MFPEDAGSFTCVAKNSAGFASTTTELIVEYPLSDHGTDLSTISRKTTSRESSFADLIDGIPPTFSKKPKTQCVPEGSDITVDARLIAIPEPEIKWYKNGKRVSSKNNVTITTSSDIHMYTTIIKITKIEKKQEGVYTIIAKNSEGESAVQFKLKVKSDDKEKPQILEPLKSHSIKKGESTILTTVIVGNPSPTIKWYKNGEPLRRVTQKDGDTYSLYIENGNYDDTAEYSVIGENSVGMAETRAKLVVEGKKIMVFKRINAYFYFLAFLYNAYMYYILLHSIITE